MNPFFTKYTYIPFDKIKFEDYEPALLKGIEEEDKEIDAIVNNPEPPTFKNTIEALDKTGSLLEGVEECFYNLLSAETTSASMKSASHPRIRVLLLSHSAVTGVSAFAS